MNYERPKMEITEVAVGVIAVSGPPAIIPNPDVEEVDFDAKSVCDELKKTYNIKEKRDYEVYE